MALLRKVDAVTVWGTQLVEGIAFNVDRLGHRRRGGSGLLATKPEQVAPYVTMDCPRLVVCGYLIVFLRLSQRSSVDRLGRSDGS